MDLNIGDISRGSDGSQKRSTPILSYINSGKLEKLLWEAQRESCQSSIGSGISSNKGRYYVIKFTYLFFFNYTFDIYFGTFQL